jgi:hypothetical protein
MFATCFLPESEINSDMGDLEVFLRLQSGLNHIEIELFSVRGNQGDEWHKAVKNLLKKLAMM